MRSEPVVMVHGWGGSFLRTWQEPGWEALLADAGRDVIGVDLLGHGTAEKPHEPEAYADLTPAITAVLPDRPVDAIGFSLGSMTLLELACRTPERLSRLVVSGVGKTLFETDRSDVIAQRGRRRRGRGRRHVAGVRAVRVVPGQRPEGARRVHAPAEDRRSRPSGSRRSTCPGARRRRRA